MKVPSMNDALKTKQIDGIITFQPYVSIATNSSDNKILADSEASMLSYIFTKFLIFSSS